MPIAARRTLYIIKVPIVHGGIEIEGYRPVLGDRQEDAVNHSDLRRCDLAIGQRRESCQRSGRADEGESLLPRAFAGMLGRRSFAAPVRSVGEWRRRRRQLVGTTANSSAFFHQWRRLQRRSPSSAA